MNHVRKTILLLLITLLTSCLNTVYEETTTDHLLGNPQGDVLVWHTWEGAERETLRETFENFMTLYPEVTIVEESFSLNQLEDEYSYHVQAGLGPDILIAPSTWSERLGEAGLIQNIGERELDLELYLTATIDMLQDGDKLYGLPLSLNTFVLYYNKNLLGAAPQSEDSSAETVAAVIQSKQQTVTDTETITMLNEILNEVQQGDSQEERFAPATTLEDLVYQANRGKAVAIRTDFYGAFWGVQAFGGQLFDKEGRVVLNQGGFANWLGWLKQAQDNPQIILNRNLDELNLLFTTGEVTYYVGSTQELPALQAALGDEVVGVVRLPGRPNKPAGPFLQAEAMMFNRVSTPHSTQLAIQVAQYLTNNEQQRQLALNIGKLPANKRVNIDPRIDVRVAEFIAQSKTAVPIHLKNLAKFNDVLAYGDDMYGQVLDGQLSVGEAATILTEQINEDYGLQTVARSQLEACEMTGRLTMWNTWTDARKDVLPEILEKFTDLCPDVTINIVDVSPSEFYEQYVTALETDESPPDIFTGSNQQLRQLAREERILNISGLIDADFLQRFIPLVEQSLLYQGNVYGIPISVDVMALYYNPTLVDDPPGVMDDLLAIADPEQQIAIPIGFEESFWGIAAFGETSETTMFDEEGHLILGQMGLTEWLAWLKNAQNQPGIVLSTQKSELETMFLEEQAAFLVGDISQLETIRTTLGDEKMRVLQLPSGSPLIKVDSLLINPFTSPDKQEAALRFAQFMTDSDIQTLLLEKATKIPTNININTGRYPLIEAFIQQANVATVIPNRREMNAVLEWGDVVYEQVLEHNISPANAVDDFTNLVNAIHGFEVIEPIEQQACTDEGTITLWHSWSDTQQLAWQEVISNFNKLCPTIQVSTTLVAEDIFSQQLTATLEANLETDDQLPPPDFFLAPHAQLEFFNNTGLIKDISALVNQDRLIDYLPRGITAFSLQDQLYGIPQAAYLPALYYRPSFVEKPAVTFEELLVQARQGQTVALNSNFYHIFWGAAALGCEPCQTGQFFNDQNELLLTAKDIAPWKNWLIEAAETGQFIFSTDQAELEQLFLDGEVTYLVASPAFLNRAEAALGVANVGIIHLPRGEDEQRPRPFLNVDGFYFYKETTDDQTKLALKFVEFATTESSQKLLMQQANYVPTRNLALVTANDPAMAPFISALDSTILLPKQNRLTVLEENRIYRFFDELATDALSSVN